MKLVLLYHGDIDGAAGRCIGTTDLPLSAQGRGRMAELAGDWPYPPPQLLIASSRKRSHTALAPFARRFGRLPQVASELDELDFGDWEGELWARLHQQQPEAIRHWMSDWVNHAPPGGESFAALARRVDRWLEALLDQQHADDLVLVSGHAGPIRALVCHALEVPLHHALLLQLSPGQVSALQRRRGRFELSYFNASRFEANLFGDDA